MAKVYSFEGEPSDREDVQFGSTVKFSLNLD